MVLLSHCLNSQVVCIKLAPYVCVYVCQYDSWSEKADQLDVNTEDKKFGTVNNTSVKLFVKLMHNLQKTTYFWNIYGSLPPPHTHTHTHTQDKVKLTGGNRQLMIIRRHINHGSFPL
jgi:hypothetical protein